MRVLITTFPKTGTNLIIQMFGMPEHILISAKLLYMGMPLNPDDHAYAHNKLTVKEMAAQIAGFPGVAFGHIPYNYSFEEALNHRPTLMVQLIRDPRDVIVSHYHHILKKPFASFNFRFEDGKLLSEREDPILDLIKLSKPRWEMFIPWMDKAHVIRYEDLRKDPRAEGRKVVALLGIKEATRLRIGSESAMVMRIRPEKSPTFRKGGVGDWKTYFQPHHVKAYEEHMGETAEVMGYGV